MSTQVVEVKQTIPLPSAEEALEYDLPQTHWLYAVGELVFNKDEKKNYVVGLHLIKGDGRVACKCELVPRDTDCYRVSLIPRDWGELYCDDSVNYLRSVVRNAMQKVANDG